MTKEREYPDGGEKFEVTEATGGTEATSAPSSDCHGNLTVEDKGNQKYAWLYLINGSDQTATVTIRRSWIYQGQNRSDTKQHVLYPREEREVFSFDRVQQPQIKFLSCSLS